MQRNTRLSDALPLLASDPGRPQDQYEECGADVALAGVLTGEHDVALHHELVLPAENGPSNLRLRGPAMRTRRSVGPQGGVNSLVEP